MKQKKKKCKSCQKDKYLFSKGMCKYCWQKWKLQQPTKKKKEYLIRAEKESRDSSLFSPQNDLINYKLNFSSLVKQLDKEFSILIRKSNADKNGTCTCFTCGKRQHWKDIQCGHFLGRTRYSVRWNYLNAFPQCKMCNYGYNGNVDDYFKTKFITLFGAKYYNFLKFESNQIRNYNESELLELLNKIKKLNESF